MIININYKKTINNSSSPNYALFLNEYNDLKQIKNYFSSSEINSIKEIIKSFNLNKRINSFNLNPKKKVFLIKIKKNENTYEIENLGAEFYEFIKDLSLKNLSINALNLNSINESFISYFLHGLKLRSYEFNKYKSNKTKKILNLTVFIKNIEKIKKNQIKFNAIEIGTNFARDLVSEPPNILYPKEYVNRLIKLRKLGIKVTVYNESKLKQMGMNSLLGVGRGSAKESFLVTLEWNGNKSKNKKLPISFVGKGVCFDTGGISLKPAKFMEEMKYDMAGSAVVAGLIQSLAIRKAKINAIGVVGLVENMPGGNAQRPGDIVKAYNGKTIEVLNTDAEGRLVLADALSFTEKKFKPEFIIDLATLTGAIIISLGEEYAGLFSNNDDLSKKIFNAGEKVNEKVWRLPLHKNYDRLMNSTIADIQNINYSGGAGSITAAQFLQRFIEKTPWAHLDIAGMAFSKKAANLNPGGATGFGVRLLNQLIEDHYE